MTQTGIYNQTCQLWLTGFHPIGNQDDDASEDEAEAEMEFIPEDFVTPTIDVE